MMEKIKQDLQRVKDFIAHFEEKEQFFDLAFEFDDYCVCLVGNDHKFKRVNHKACNFFERSEEELKNLTFDQITHPDDLRKDLELIENTGKGERKHYKMAKLYEMPDGSYKAGHLAVSIFRDHEGEIHMYFVIIAAEEELESMLSEIRERKAQYVG